MDKLFNNVWDALPGNRGGLQGEGYSPCRAEYSGLSGEGLKPFFNKAHGRPSFNEIRQRIQKIVAVRNTARPA